MSPPELGEGAAAPPEAPATLPPLQLRVEDILAAGKRLWVRGQLPLREAADHGSRWRPWAKARNGQPADVHLQTRLGGHTCEATIPLQADNCFEARFEADIPPARRGWRLARHAVTYAGQTAEQCGVVLLPPRQALQAVVVVLPLAYSAEAGGAERLARCFDARGLAPVLRRLHEGAGAARPVYYLAGVSPGQPSSHAELALATASLSWPQGHFVLLPASADDFAGAVDTALDRLRWLFASTLEPVVLNLEPRAAAALDRHRTEAEDRAAVAKLVQPDDDPWSALAAPPAQAPRTRSAVGRVRRSASVTRHPVVFCHGMLALTTLRMQLPEDLNCFFPLNDFLRARGYDVYFPQVGATSGVKERAEQLRDQIRRWADGPVNIVAHSMGGLDARWMITHLDMASRVASLTTVSTPHRGTFLAEWFQHTFRHRVPVLLAMEALGVNVDGFRDCQRDACLEFNKVTPDMPDVRYFSFGGAVSAARVTPALRRGLNLLTPVEGPNDGMVSLHSACWGEYLGTLQADHYAQTPDSVFVRPGEDFDSLRFYSRLVEDLARRGF